MNLRLENKDIRIRLTEREWMTLNDGGRIQGDFELGLPGKVVVELLLSDHNVCEMEGLTVQIHVAKESLQKPVRKKDPHWTYVTDRGVRWSLDVDIIPEEKR